MRRLGMAACLLLAACGGAPPEPVQPPAPAVVTFDGIAVAGGPEEAKASGLRVCEPASDGFTCEKSEGVTLLGAPALSASAWLTYPYDLPQEKRQPSAVRYKWVEVKFAPVEFDYACVYGTNADPTPCAEDGYAPMVAFERKLWADGWRYTNMRHGRRYVKAGTLVEVTVGPGYKGTVSLTNLTPEVEAAELKRIQDDAAKRTQAAAETDQFISKMAN